MPFVQRVVEPKYLSKASLLDADEKPIVDDYELEAVANNTLCNALRQLASLVLVADDIFQELKGDLQKISERSDKLKVRIGVVDGKVQAFDPKKVSVPVSDIAHFALLRNHYHIKHDFHTNLFDRSTRPNAVKELYAAAARTPIHLMRQLDRWRRDGHRSSRFFMCTPILGGGKRRRIRNKIDIDIETRMPALVEDLRRWTSTEALGDVTVTTDGGQRIRCNATDGDITDGNVVSDDEAIDHKLPSPEEQLQVVALKFPAEIVAVDVTGKSFDRMCGMRRSLMNGETTVMQGEDGSTIRRRSKSRKPRNRRRNTLAGTDQKEIRDALTAADEQSNNSAVQTDEVESSPSIGGPVGRSKSSDLLRKRDSPDHSTKKSHFSTLKQWGKKMIANYTDGRSNNEREQDEEVNNIYETVTLKRKRNIDKERKSMHERKPSCSSSSEKSSINITINTPLTAAMNIATVKLRDSSAQRRLRRTGGNKDEPHSSSGNWSASSESGRASIGSEITTTTQPKSTTSAATSSNSLNLHPPSSVNSRRRYNINTSASGSVTSEGTLTPDIIHDLHEDGETSSVYSCDTEGYYTSFHMDSGLKTLKEEDSPATPLHSTSTFSTSSANTAENEYELFGRGSTSTTTSSAGTVCTTLRAAVSNRSLIIGPVVPERKSSLSSKSKSPESSLERDYSSEKTGTVKRSPATTTKSTTVVAQVHKDSDGDVSPDSGHNTSSSPIESMNSPNGVRSGSEFEYSESSDMEGADRIERIRVKTTINSSRIPSMCVITPTQSDDESVKSNQFEENQINNNLMSNRLKLELPIKAAHEHNNNVADTSSKAKIQVINVNPQTGYATIETHVSADVTKSSHRAASPSGGTVTFKQTTPSKSPQLQPIFKATLMPLNNMLGKLKLNLSSLTTRSSKSPGRNTEDNVDAGEYVTIADVKNNNEKADTIYANDVVNRNLCTVLSGKIRETEYISLNELPCNESHDVQSVTSDSLERRRKGARVTLNSDGKVIYSSDSLKRRRGAHTTFEPGPFVKSHSPQQSPLPAHRTMKNKNIKRTTDDGQPLSPQLGKVVIKATNGTTEIVRMPPSTIVSPSLRPMSPTKQFNTTRGAYVNVLNEGRALSPSNQQMHAADAAQNYYASREFENGCHIKRGTNMYSTLPNRKPQYSSRVLPERSVTPDIMRGLSNVQQYNSLDRNKERERRGPHHYDGIQQYSSLDRRYHMGPDEFEGFVEYPPPPPLQQQQPIMTQNLGIPVQIPQVNMYNLRTPQVPHNFYQNYHQPYESPPKRELATNMMDSPFKISPIDPRNLGGVRTSTPAKVQELKACANLERQMLSPKKSSMTNEELYAVIHKTKKKMNIQSEDIDRPSPSLSPVSSESSMTSNKSSKPETGYLGDKSKSRLSWSPNGEYIDFNTNIDKIPPESRSRQSWACSADSSSSTNKKDSQTSRLDFKRLLLMHGKSKPAQQSKKLSAVEQLKQSKQQLLEQAKADGDESDVSILDLSQSPRNMRNRKFVPPGSPNKSADKQQRPVPKLLSPRSQWRFANPRSDVLSSTIPEDCHEDETSNCSRSPTEVSSFQDIKQKFERDLPKTPPMTATQRLQAQRAQFFSSTSVSSNSKSKPNNSTNNAQGHTPFVNRESAPSPTLETAF